MRRTITHCASLFGLLLLALFTSSPLRAGDILWYLVADETKYVEMSKVSIFVASDEEATFNILDHDGNVLLQDVSIVQFKQMDNDMIPDGIEEIEPSAELPKIAGMLNNRLTLVGLSGLVQVYSVSGVLMSELKATPEETIIDVSDYLSGVYIVVCGELSFKFVKL